MLRQANDAVATQLRADAEQAIARDRQAMRESLEHDAADLAVTIATRLLERMPPQIRSIVPSWKGWPKCWPRIRRAHRC